MKLYPLEVLLTFSSRREDVDTMTTTILGANHDVAHKAPMSTLRYDTAGNGRADVTSVITCIYCRINIE